MAAIVALAAGVLPNIPGFLVSAAVWETAHPLLLKSFSFAWFVGFGIATVVYYFCMRAAGRCAGHVPQLAADL